jgi:Zn finger protein HypA/HybF involved in hydrogenase expression
MADSIVDGVVLPDDENVVVVPAGYSDTVITKEHFTIKNIENVVTCNMLVQDVLKKIGTEVVCPDCGRKFMVVRQEDMTQK